MLPNPGSYSHLKMLIVCPAQPGLKVSGFRVQHLGYRIIVYLGLGVRMPDKGDTPDKDNVTYNDDYVARVSLDIKTIVRDEADVSELSLHLINHEGKGIAKLSLDTAMMDNLKKLSKGGVGAAERPARKYAEPRNGCPQPSETMTNVEQLLPKDFLPMCFEGKMNYVVKLLDQGVDIDVQNKGGWTALMLASRNGKKKVVQKLLDQGANVNLQNNDGQTALIVASVHNHVNVVEELLLRHVQLGLIWENIGNAKPSSGTEIINRLLAEALAGKTRFTDRELDNLNVSNLSDSSYIKVGENYFQPRGLNLNLQALDGMTALSVAKQKGHTSIERLLRGKGAKTIEELVALAEKSSEAMARQMEEGHDEKLTHSEMINEAWRVAGELECEIGAMKKDMAATRGFFI